MNFQLKDSLECVIVLTPVYCAGYALFAFLYFLYVL